MLREFSMRGTIRHAPDRFNARRPEKGPDRLLLCAAMSEWSREALGERIFQILRDEILSVEGNFSPQSNLVESGLDSLAVTQLMLSIEESTGIWVDESLLTPEHLESAETLAALVHAQLQGD
jgi:acyl carrier protein